MIKTPIKFLISIIFVAIIGAAFYYIVLPRIQNAGTENKSGKETFKVIKVVDGDTFKLANGEKVRLLGIDTPEKFESKKLEKDAEMSGQDKKTIKTLGKLASEYAKNLFEGKNVYLEKEPNYDDVDRYGRLLRYVYLEDGTFVNGKLVQDGYAQVYEKFPVSKLDELRKYQKEARENNKGLWGEVEGLKQFNK